MTELLKNDAAGKLLLRLTVGGLMLFHGISKLFNPGTAGFIGSKLADAGLPEALAYGVYIAIQYVPQMIEAKSVSSILRSIKSDEDIDRNVNERIASNKLIKLLQTNEMDYMKGSYSVRQFNNEVTIKFSYDRELDLVYTMKKIHYERSLTLN